MRLLRRWLGRKVAAKSRLVWKPLNVAVRPIKVGRRAGLGGLHTGELPKSVAAFGIAGGIGQLFSTHPPIEERIAALQNS